MASKEARDRAIQEASRKVLHGSAWIRRAADEETRAVPTLRDTKHPGRGDDDVDAPAQGELVPEE